MKTALSCRTLRKNTKNIVTDERICMEKKLKVLYSGYVDPKHSKFGGYEKIISMPDTSFLDARRLPFGFIPLGVKGKKLNFMVLDFFTHLQAYKYDIIHYFYFVYMMYKKAPKNCAAKFVCTVHINCDEFNEKQLAVLRSFDAVVCLSLSQEEALRKKGIKSFFIPHGYDKPVYNHDENFAKEKIDLNKINIMYSGNMYRDFETFIKIAKFCEEKKLNICFHCCGQKKNIQNFWRTVKMLSFILF